MEHSDEWCRRRKHVICASELADIMGVGRKSRGRVIQMKGDDAPLREEMNSFGKKMCDYGHMCEPLALIAFEKAYPWPLIKIESLLYFDFRKYPLEGQPDSITIDENGGWIPVEVKTHCGPTFEDALPHTTEEVPSSYWIQVQAYILLLDAPYGYLVSYTGFHGWRVFRVTTYRPLQEHMLKYVNDWFEDRLVPRVKTSENQVTRQLIDDMITFCVEASPVIK